MTLTIEDEVHGIAPGRDWVSLAAWPPDVFAATAVTLGDSGGYRCVVCPPEGEAWPPIGLGSLDDPWEKSVRQVGVDWASRLSDGCPPGETDGLAPDAVIGLCRLLDAAAGTPIEAFEEHWGVTSALLTLHAIADEACSGAGLRAESRFQRDAMARLNDTGSLSRLPVDRVRVLPKLRAPDSGITLRSISHNLALDRSEVRSTWLHARHCPNDDDRIGSGRITMLLVPYPSSVHASDFRHVVRPLLNMDPNRFGFYEYAPDEALDPAWVVELVEAALPRVGNIDVVVLPESAVGEAVLPRLQEMLISAGVSCLITGVHRSAGDDAAFGANYAYIGGEGWRAVQHKHHRWCLDTAQIHQYHLGAALDPSIRWWEAISVQKRKLSFVSIPGDVDMTVCPLVCEDLARPDPVTDVIRAVAPTLVVGLLLDGPQLASRWPARYASVLADDPGCSVLTLTALGMTWRSQPPGFDPSRVIALWKDPHRGLQQITLSDGARAIALTAHRRDVSVVSADGRDSAEPVSELVLSGIEQIP